MSEQTKPATASEKAVAVNPTQKLFDLVSSKINSLISEGGINTPDNYDASNAMRSAWLMLQDQKDRNEKPVLEVCTKESIANALMKMVVQGMNPAKNQCYFIPYGSQLNYQRSYMGSYALAKRVSNLKEVNAVLIYENDVFSYEVDTKTGRKRITNHEQKFEDIDETKIKGGYAIVVFEDGSSDVVIMTKAQVEKSWQQGATKGGSPAHKNFAGEMTLKTIRSKAVKLLINSSDDSNLMSEDETPTIEEGSKQKIVDKANKEPLTIEEPIQDAEVVESKVAESEEPAVQPNSLFDDSKPSFAE